MFGTVPNVLVVNPSVPATSFAELAAWIKADPPRANIASLAIGISQHRAIELNSMTGMKAMNVPYKGGAPQRSKQLPNVPTLAEAGVAGYDVTNWVGLCAPSAVAPERVQKLYAAVQDVLRSGDTDKNLREIG